MNTHSDVTKAPLVSSQILIYSLFKNSVVGVGIIFKLYLSVNVHMKLCGSGKGRLKVHLLKEQFLPGRPVNSFEHLANSISEISQVGTL